MGSEIKGKLFRICQNNKYQELNNLLKNYDNIDINTQDNEDITITLYMF